MSTAADAPVVSTILSFEAFDAAYRVLSGHDGACWLAFIDGPHVVVDRATVLAEEIRVRLAAVTGETMHSQGRTTS